MKLKYYLRGIGVGFIISAIMFMIAFPFYKPSLSQKDLEKIAEEKGYTLVEKESSTLKNDKKKKLDDKNKKGKKTVEKHSKVKDAKEKKEERKKQKDKLNNKDKKDKKSDSESNEKANVKADNKNKAPGYGANSSVKFVVMNGESSFAISKNLKDFGIIKEKVR